MVAMASASLQPAPATISLRSGLFSFIIATYSEILIFCFSSLPSPKYFGWSFSQMPITASTVNKAEIITEIGIIMSKNAAVV